MTTSLSWQTRTTPAELRPMLKTLEASHSIRQGATAAVRVQFEKVDDAGMCRVQLSGRDARVIYATPAQAARGVGALLGGLVPRGKMYEETTPFEMLGIMLDCSRNAVMTVDHIKVWLNRLALLGYNMVMLYTEDTYRLPGEPWFGYQRGAYTAAELKAIDRYAAKLNIEVIPCIQTLGHLEKILRHGAYANVKDTARVMMVGEKETYALIDKMLGHWRSVCRTDRVHIGMDETHDLGRGRYLDRHGYRDGFELFNEHLSKVVQLCKKHGLKPMIWSDMYFRLGSKTGNYYDPETVIPQQVVDRIPRAAQLVYWDYYHEDESFYRDWIERHRAMGKEPLMGSGIWTWNRYWYDCRSTERRAGACIDACYQANVKELFFTQWGDNGAYCDHDSAFAGMTYCADKAYGTTDPSPAALEKRFGAVCGGSYAAHILAGDIHGGIEGLQPSMWDDPFFEKHFRTWANDRSQRMAAAAKGFAGLARKLKRHVDDRATGNLSFAWQVARTFAERYGLSAALLAAYRKKDKRALRAVRRRIPRVIDSVRALEEAYREMWLSHNKPEGLGTIQGRLGMLQARYREMSRRIGDYTAGRVSELAELEYKCPPKG